MVNQERLDLFTAGLRSGRFKQGSGTLTRFPKTEEAEHCCLGVACIIAMENGLVLDYDDGQDDDGQRWYLTDRFDENPDAPRSPADYNQSAELPRKVMQWYGFDEADPEILVHIGTGDEQKVAAAHANDSMGLTFEQIADAFDATYGPGPHE